MAYYFAEALDVTARQHVIARCLNAIKWSGAKTIAVRGVSGLVVGPIVANLLGLNLVVIRKPNEQNHWGCSISGEVVGDYAILDDFIASGETVREMLSVIGRYSPSARCVGFYGYSGASWLELSAGQRARLLEKVGLESLVPDDVMNQHSARSLSSKQ